MKKSRKIFGAVALSAVLAFGTAVPAFAVTSGTDASNQAINTYDENDTGGASTTVNIATFSSHYSVTLPIKLPFMLDQMGGDGIAPTNYYIQNNGDQAAVEIYDVTWSMAAGNDTGAAPFFYTFGDAPYTAQGVTPSAGLNVGNPANPQYGSFVVEATAASQGTGTPAVSFNTVKSTAANLPDGGVAAGMVTKGADGNPLATPMDGARYGFKTFGKDAWEISKATNTMTPTVCPITLKITGSKLNAGTPENEIANVASLIYTVGPAR